MKRITVTNREAAKITKLLSQVREQDKGELTLDQLFEVAFKEHWSSERYLKSGWAKEVERLYRTVLSSVFGSHRLSELTAKRIREWHQSLNATPIKANRSLEVLSRLYRFAEEKELRAQGLNPCLLVKAFKEAKRKRYATEQELKKIGEILSRKSLDYPKASVFIYLLIFTGARPRSLERATWDMLKTVDVDGKTFGVLNFHGKTSHETGEEEQVIIPPHGMELINKLPKDSDFILGIKLPTPFWRVVRQEAGCPDLWARDLRRTFATTGLSSGKDIGVIGELLNHKTIQTTKIYAKLIDSKRLEAVSEIADKMTDILKKGAG